MRPHWHTLFLALALVPNCGGTTQTDRISPEEYWERRELAECVRLFECDASVRWCEVQLLKTVERCAATRWHASPRADWVMLELRRGVLVYDEDRALACLRALERCDADPKVACADVFRGAAPPGGHCRYDLACSSGNYCVSVNGTTCNGVCVEQDTPLTPDTPLTRDTR
jgi:hypothetical protein